MFCSYFFTVHVKTYLNTLTDSKGLPLKSNNAWLSHDEPPYHLPASPGSYEPADDVAHP